jgi:uncharacterized protein YbgA (DUF1722 family)/uncharacterized protein YbbK (DUF523 family)
MEEFPRPVVFVSSCLAGKAVRYNGQASPCELVDKIAPFVRIIDHCPEVEIGLGIPRAPIRIVADNADPARRRLLQPETGAELGETMRAWARDTLDGLGSVDGFIMKSKSPSSGVYDVKIYASAAGQPAITTRGAGFFGAEILSRYPDAAIEDEGRLNDDRIRDNFLKRIFTVAGFRVARDSGHAADLVRFHSANKLLFMSYNQGIMREMGRVASNLRDSEVAPAFAEYERLMMRLLSHTYRPTNLVNALEHAFGYFKSGLSPAEKRHFLELLSKYRDGLLPVSAVVALIDSWIIRFGERYLANQTLFRPYPGEIIRPKPRKNPDRE